MGKGESASGRGREVGSVQMKYKLEALEPPLGKGESASTEVREEKIRNITKLQKKNMMNKKKNNQ